MKKILSTILILSILFSMAIIPVSADGERTFSQVMKYDGTLIPIYQWKHWKSGNENTVISTYGGSTANMTMTSEDKFEQAIAVILSPQPKMEKIHQLHIRYFTMKTMLELQLKKAWK